MSSSGITPDFLSVGDLLYGRNPFYIPRYQRAFAWEQDEIDDFTRDISRLIDLRKTDPMATHFFGGMVSVLRQRPGTLRGAGYEVVDGQQRLATLMIALQRIYDSLLILEREAGAAGDDQTKVASGNFSTKLRTDFIKYDELDERGNKTERYRLELSLADREYFVQLLGGSPPAPQRDSHQRLTSARQRIQKDLCAPILTDSWSTKEKLPRLLAVRDAILDGSNVIHMVADSTERAYTLFAILNDRGRSLSDGDLLRAYTLEQLEAFPALQDTTARNWDAVLAGTVAKTAWFLAAWYPSKTGVRASRDLNQDYRNKFFHTAGVTPTSEEADAISQVVATLRAEHELFEMIDEGDWPFDQESSADAWDRDRLHRLIVVLRHDLCVPLLIAAAAHLSEAGFSALVLCLEKFAFRYKNICGGHPSAAASKYYEAAQNIRLGSFSLAGFEETLGVLVATAAPDALFRAQLRIKLDYERAQQRGNIKYFLGTLEDYGPWFRRGGVETPEPDKTRVLDLHQVELEHVYPQSAVAKCEELESVKHHLGNLTFWGPGDNKAATNAPFENKRPIYGASSVGLTRDLSREAEWTRERVESRAGDLVEKGVKLFAFPPGPK